MPPYEYTHAPSSSARKCIPLFVLEIERKKRRRSYVRGRMHKRHLNLKTGTQTDNLKPKKKAVSYLKKSAVILGNSYDVSQKGK